MEMKEIPPRRDQIEWLIVILLTILTPIFIFVIWTRLTGSSDKEGEGFTIVLLFALMSPFALAYTLMLYIFDMRKYIFLIGKILFVFLALTGGIVIYLILYGFIIKSPWLFIPVIIIGELPGIFYLYRKEYRLKR